MGKKKKNQSNIMTPATSNDLPVLPDPVGALGKPDEEDSEPLLSETLETRQVPECQTSNLKIDKPSSVRFSGGTWRGKASAIAEVARDNIAVAANAASDSFQSMNRSSSPAQRLSRSLRSSSKGSPNGSPITKLGAKSNIRNDRPDGETAEPSNSDKIVVEDEVIAITVDQSLLAKEGGHGADAKGTADDSSFPAESGSAEAEMIAVNDDDPLVAKSGHNEANGPDRPLPAPGWRGWWTKPVVDCQKDVDKTNVTCLGTDTTMAEALSAPDSVAVNETKTPTEHLSEVAQGESTSVQDVAKISLDQNEPSEGSNEVAARQSRTTWFGLWGAGQSTAVNTNLGSAHQKSDPAEPAQSIAPYVPQASSETPPAAPQPAAPAHPSSTWAFWSRPTIDSFDVSNEQSKADAGELSVTAPSTKSNPKPAYLKAAKNQPSSTTDKVKKNDRSSLLASAEIATSRKLEKNKQKLNGQKPVEATPMKVEKSSGTEKITKVIDNKSLPKLAPAPQYNLILPAFNDTYHLDQTPSYMQQILRVLGRGSLPGQAHLTISTSPPRIRKALSIGVHGYFPAPLLQKVLGQPTGTSVRFAIGGAKAIQKWTSSQGYSCEIEKIALEGEGMITDRVDILWKLLLNWIDKIRQADFVMITCHSQGVPVSVMLVAKLIDFGCIKPSARLGICGMAGVNLGPFSSYQNRLFSGSASELFSFADSSSTVSKDYSLALNLALKHQVRILYIGSIDDQLVSLESSTFSNISHPYIYRAVFVDGRIHAPDFITHLVGFALKLRNLGISDHGLIRELSVPLAGSLYTGEGHSRIYDDQAVYELAVQHALETTNLPGEPPLLEIKAYEAPSSGNSNPYVLPWAMRGLLEEEFVKMELKDETKELLRLFEGWKPSSKVLKDVKFRLEAVKSML